MVHQVYLDTQTNLPLLGAPFITSKTEGFSGQWVRLERCVCKYTQYPWTGEPQHLDRSRWERRDPQI